MTFPFNYQVTHFEKVLSDDLIYGPNINAVASALAEKCRTLFHERPLLVTVEDYSGKHVTERQIY